MMPSRQARERWRRQWRAACHLRPQTRRSAVTPGSGRERISITCLPAGRRFHFLQHADQDVFGRTVVLHGDCQARSSQPEPFGSDPCQRIRHFNVRAARMNSIEKASPFVARKNTARQNMMTDAIFRYSEAVHERDRSANAENSIIYLLDLFGYLPADPVPATFFGGSGRQICPM